MGSRFETIGERAQSNLGVGNQAATKEVGETCEGLVEEQTQRQNELGA